MDAGAEEEDGREEASVGIQSLRAFCWEFLPGRAELGQVKRVCNLPCEAGNLGKNQFPAPVDPIYSPVSRVSRSKGWVPVGSWLTCGFFRKKKGLLLQGMLQGWGCHVRACTSTWTRVYPTQWAFHGLLRSLWEAVFLKYFWEF